jgi:hypothetical protein
VITSTTPPPSLRMRTRNNAPRIALPLLLHGSPKIAPQWRITSTGWLLVALDDGTLIYGEAELGL